jgi:uncharacterized membrane protein (Fun14 family)
MGVQMSLEVLTPLATQLGMGGIIGFVVGYALKKLFKLIIVLIVIFFVILQYLAYTGFIVVNYDQILIRFQGFAQSFLQLGSGGFAISTLLQANIPFIGAFIVGLGVGLKVG